MTKTVCRETTHDAVNSDRASNPKGQAKNED